MSIIKLNNNGVKNATAFGSITGLGSMTFIKSSLPNVTFAVTVADASGNKYFIDGVQQDTIALYRGGTYTFDQSHSSNAGHPLRLSSTSNGTHNSGSEYTTGVTTSGTAGSSGAKTVITVPQDAPTLYYYCTNHSNMGGTANISGVSTISFVDGSNGVVLDDTYKEYLFTFKNIHPETDGQQFKFQTSTNGGSSYGTTITSTYFIAYHNENGSESALTYITGSDQAQTTNFMVLGSGDNQSDSGIGGTMTLFNPSSTTFVKHFIGRTINDPSGYAQDEYTAGYFNTTSAINAVQFKFASGNIDAGDICLYGIA